MKDQIPRFVLSYWNEACTPRNVRVHCVMVAKIAEYLLSSLRDQGYDVDTEMGYLGGLLHDTYRVINFPSAKTIEYSDVDAHCVEVWEQQIRELGHVPHERMIADVLQKDGHDRLARVVRFHENTRVFDLVNADEMWEEKCLYYADKRVAHAQVVTFAERIEEAKKRYQWSDEELEEYRHVWDSVFLLEKKLFSVLPFEPLDLNKLNETIVVPENLYS